MLGGDIVDTEHRLRFRCEFCARGPDVLGKLGEDCECVGLLRDLYMESGCSGGDAEQIRSLVLREAAWMVMVG